MNSTEKDANETTWEHSEFHRLLYKLTIDEVRYVRRQFQIGNVSGKDRESDLFALLAKFSGKRTDGDAVKEKLGIFADSSIVEFLQELELGDTAGSSDTARQAVGWCDEVLKELLKSKTENTPQPSPSEHRLITPRGLRHM